MSGLRLVGKRSNQPEVALGAVEGRSRDRLLKAVGKEIKPVHFLSCA